MIDEEWVKMTSSKQFDSIDAKILVALDDDPNASITQIAKTVGLSRNTVETHIKRLYSKLEAHTRMEAVHRARSFGLIA